MSSPSANREVHLYFAVEYKSMYGAWIDRRGNLYPVISPEYHWDTAAQLIGTTRRLFHKGRSYLGKCYWTHSHLLRYSIYAIMFRFGYVRLTFGEQTLYIEYPKMGANKKQLLEINNIKELHSGEILEEEYIRPVYIIGERDEYAYKHSK